MSLNAAACALLGYAEEELIGRPVDTIIATEQGGVAEILAMLAAEAVGTSERTYRTRDGVNVPVLFSASIMHDDNGGVQGIVCVAQDITERRRVQNELELRNLILSTQQETSLEGILVVDEQTKIISYNQRFIELWQIPPDMVAAKDDMPVLKLNTSHTADPAGFVARVKYLYAHKEEKSHEEILLKDGRVIDRYSSPMFASNGKYYGRVWYFNDITERKQAEKRLTESLSLKRATLESTADGILVVNGQGNVVDFNSKFMELWGIPPGSHGTKR